LLDWSAEKSQALATHWENGLSASQIAALMDTTRSAVIGRARRMQLASRAREPGMTLEERREKDRLRKRVNRPRPAREIVKRRLPEIELNIPFADLAPFSNREPNQCRFMAAAEPAPRYLCCGRETEDGQAYCARHFALTRQPRF
jgi:hypothetical protein